MTLDDASDTVAGRLRMPLSSESFLAEPQLQRALAAAAAMPMPSPDAPSGADLAVVPASDMPETLGEYRLLEELGRGGMGRVYKALHTKLDRVVALKVLSRGRVGDRQAIARFEREMKAVGRLAHPNIVQAHDAREIDGTPVLVMEFVDGLDLAEFVRRVGRGAGRRGLRVGPPHGRWPCNAPTSTGWCIATSSPRTSCSRGRANEAPGSRSGPLLCRGRAGVRRRPAARR